MLYTTCKNKLKLDHGPLCINTQNFSRILDSFDLNKDFSLQFNTTSTVHFGKNIDKLDLMKITNSFPSEGTVKMNKPATSYEKIFAKFISDEGLV